MKKLAGIFIFSSLLVSCIDEIEFDTDFERKLTISGKITNSSIDSPFVTVSYSGRSGNPDSLIIDANVVLMVDNQESIPMIHRGSGKYEPVLPVIGEPGRSYSVFVEHNGQTYRSTPEMLPTAIGKDTLAYEVVQLEQINDQGVEFSISVIDIRAETTLPNEEVYLRWEIEESYTFTELILPAFKFPFSSPKLCFITKPVQTDEIKLFNNVGNTASLLPFRNLINREIDDTFEEIHYFAVFQHSITPEAYAYWENINDVAFRDGSLFETPPAAVRGNFQNTENPDELVLGYFEAARVDTASFFVTNEEIGFRVPEECGLIPAEAFRDIPSMCVPCVREQLGVREACLDCLTLPNSSLERPPYFPPIETISDND
jgi:hypothetical protein